MCIVWSFLKMEEAFAVDSSGGEFQMDGAAR